MINTLKDQMLKDQNLKDQDRAKGAKEPDEPKAGSNVGLKEQLSHRTQDPMIKDADTDFPEPGENPEHSGEWNKRSA
ncbi:MAG TPA: hypothetical protein VMX38_14175 [Verrucomicrobiae bacterium]|jgi:hypothetical protein|nr:hypothetical protein [Verrucomicrobiae bacterium]